MPKPVLVFLKLVAAVATFICIEYLTSGSELQTQVGTVILALISCLLTFFGRSSVLRSKALIFSVLVVVVSRAVDYYFWHGVWDRGFPWPYSMSESNQNAFIGSISPYIGQVADISFVILLIIALIAAFAPKIFHASGTD